MWGWRDSSGGYLSALLEAAAIARSAALLSLEKTQLYCVLCRLESPGV